MALNPRQFMKKYYMHERALGSDMLLQGGYYYTDEIKGYTVDWHIAQWQAQGWQIVSLCLNGGGIGMSQEYAVVMRFR
jgi:hypothetical protein